MKEDIFQGKCVTSKWLLSNLMTFFPQNFDNIASIFQEFILSMKESLNHCWKKMTCFHSFLLKQGKIVNIWFQYETFYANIY